ncbi:alpha/beta-hydrolase [Clavulina sp. PMI_390]|nr:alpha/beta-hydrolase [Clavulina sp. PMI_390]
MGVSTTGAAVAITPVVIKVFVKHYARRLKHLKKEANDEEARDSILFDEAFSIVKAFIAFACRNTVESLQTFTNTHIPSPYWFKTVPVTIPLSTLTPAARIITSLLGPRETLTLLGGAKWWQVRAIDGVGAEWIAMKADVRGVPYGDIEKESEKEQERDSLHGRYVQGMDRLNRVMLYIHGGGFYWGSINTHRYQLGRFARKMKSGRVFTVNYRKAPHYPFPCPLQDCIAAYLYLINPPAGAPHKPIPASNIIIAGDSAGGNLALTLLTVIRDAGLPSPAGGVLISPWVDLTHSFPSVMDNTATDILTPHGFIHEPSPLWPLPPKDSQSHILAIPTVADEAGRLNTSSADSSSGSGIRLELSPEGASAVGLDAKEGVESITAEIRSQIQLYATNEQLSHPLVSPLLNPSLGGLPPLYILAGDGECLRDEIIYLAHRAAQPQVYSLSERPTEGNWSYGKGGKVEHDGKTTNVRLQVFDGMCHVLTVFTFIDSAHYAYRAIGEFARHVIPHPESGHSQIAEHTHAEGQLEGRHSSPSMSTSVKIADTQDAVCPEENQQTLVDMMDKKLEDVNMDTNPTKSKTPTAVSPALTPPGEREDENAASASRSHTPSPMAIDPQVPTQHETFVRQRISIHGVPRPLEPSHEIPILASSLHGSASTPSSTTHPIFDHTAIGVISEAPVIRWLTGLQMYDKKYKRQAKKSLAVRTVNQKRAEGWVEKAKVAGVDITPSEWEWNFRPGHTGSDDEEIELLADGVKRPLDVLDLRDGRERPPPSAICGRTDTAESLVLLRSALLTRKKHHGAVLSRAHESPARQPTVVQKAQSELQTVLEHAGEEKGGNLAQPPAAEMQVEPTLGKASHGVRLWAGMMKYVSVFLTILYFSLKT